MVLVIALNLAGLDIERDRRGGIKIVARPLVTHPGAAVAGAPERQLGLRGGGAGDPHRAAAGLPLVALRPGLAAGLAGGRHRVGLPQRLPSLAIERRDEAADTESATRG